MTKTFIEEAKKYTIDVYGNVEKNGKRMSPFYKTGGYLRVGLVDNNKKQRHFSIHRLVAKAFIPNPLNLPQINHINGIKTDNRVENLEWTNASDNIKHAYKLGLITPLYGEEHQNCKIKDRDSEIIKRILYLIEEKKIRLTLKEISIIFGIDSSTIVEIKKGEIHKNDTKKSTRNSKG